VNKIIFHPKYIPMKTLKITTLLLLTIMSITWAMAQPQQADGRDKIESLKIAFITERLSLTPEQAQKFWPAYNQFNDEMKKLRQAYKPNPETQLTADQTLEFDQKKLDLKKRYKVQFETILGKEKVNTLYNLEDEFRQKMKDLHEQRHSSAPAGAGPRKP